MQTTDTIDRPDILQRIVESRRRQVEKSKSALSKWELIARINGRDRPRGFRAAVSSRADISVIAELKKGSPTRGVIRETFSPVHLARCFAENGAAAVSVLTEPGFFFGNPAYLGGVRKAVKMPLLRKDFIIDPYQVYESRVLGADAVLLIVKIVEHRLLRELIRITRALGMDCLVEVNTEAEVETALSVGADLIGINNRNLETLAVDRDTSIRLKPLIPSDIPVVALSGIRSRDDIEEYTRVGIRSFLIGQSLMEIDDIRDMGRVLRSLVGKTKDVEL